ncbi:hypothetical protein [Pseudoalteromonas spongiae]|uniref:hypothetical protein n=1 Tax=Pseudoalteromonas spongiae TaxID=298657 RepID=UPI003736A231
MLNKRIEPELFGSTPDLDQVAQSKEPIAQSSKQAPSAPQNVPDTPAVKKSSNVFTWLGAISIIALAAGGYTLYQQNLATQVQLAASNQRIAELESALSATGEEMGESAGAIKAKVSALSKRTDELWTQMDKLWASAWRRNQSEIKQLKDQASDITKNQKTAQANVSSELKTLSQNHTELTLKLSVLEEQQQATKALKNQLSAVNTELDQIKSKSQGRDAKQVEIGGSIAELEMTQNALAEQLQRLESKLATAKPAQL